MSPYEVALVKLVEHDRAHSAQRGVERHPAQQDPLRHKPDPRPFADARLEPDLVSHRVAERRPRFLGHALGEHPRGEPARLEHDDLAPPAEQPVAQEHLRDLRRFSRARRRLHDQPARSAQRPDDPRFEFVDRQVLRVDGHGEEAVRNR